MSGRAAAVLSLGVLVVLGLLAGGIALLRADDLPARVRAAPVASLAPDARTPAELARRACVQLSLAEQGIRAEASAEGVRRQLASARALAAQALRSDGRYAALSGGLAALDEAVRRDDGPAAAAGLQVARAQCDAL